ncbi:hypothetical protein MKQ70_13485 [Chitinophaga sedimenti]|uniref:hypothetical protein n=1 Tax=Chitinophaga sedimenti TaxID=2033606 RepID=UPI002004EA93|nr:hypothetical protein [Chitinophaga sedimenti]MCK7555978.1 hypothetical protein [Chitinophaga sedimenti]
MRTSKYLATFMLLAAVHVVRARDAVKPDENRFTKVVLQQKLEEPMQFQCWTTAACCTPKEKEN